MTTPVDITLAKEKYRTPKPRGRFKADYNGNSGAHRLKGDKHPAIHGIKRKRHTRSYSERIQPAWTPARRGKT